MGLRAWIYDRALLPLTSGWYQEVLDRMPRGSRMLDVGIGTAGALANNAEVIQERNLQVVGIDIDPDYVRRARARVQKAGIADRVDVRLESVYTFESDPFDAVYFSASFMLLPDPVAALEHVIRQLVPGGKVYFTQTFQDKRSPVMEKVKPLLKTVTTVDFGGVTYERDFMEILDAAGAEVVEHKCMEAKRSMSYRLVVIEAVA